MPETRRKHSRGEGKGIGMHWDRASDRLIILDDKSYQSTAGWPQLNCLWNRAIGCVRSRLNILGVEQFFTVAFVIRITEWLKLCLIYVPGTLLSMCLRVCSNSGMECHFYLVQVVPVLGSAILILWSMFQDTQVRFERRFMLKRFTVNTPEYYVWAIPKYYCFRLANSDDNAGLPGALDPWIGWVSSREYLLVLFE